jgi:hypothetical protein
MPGRTLDAIIQEALGIKEMVIARLMWQIEDLKAQIEELQRVVPADTSPKD